MSHDDPSAPSEPNRAARADADAGDRPGRGCAAQAMTGDSQLPLRRRGQVALETDAAAALQHVLDAFPAYVMLIDEQHNILLANQAVSDALGVEPCAVIGGYCPKVVHRAEGPYPGCPLEQARKLGRAVECEDADAQTGRILQSGVYPTPYETAAGVPVYLHAVKDITAQRQAEARLKRNLEAQALVNDLLRIALEESDLEAILQRVVDRVVAIPWLSTRPKAMIFLADEAQETLVLTAHQGAEPALLDTCARVGFGQCHCGQAATARAIQHTSCVDDAHEHGFEGMGDHGHYCVPIAHGETVLGVLTTTVDPGHERDEGELEFLGAVADVLAGIIKRKRAEALQLDHQRVALSRERMARVGEVSAGVAHTIRNPLHGVLNCVEIVESQAERGEVASGEILSMMRDGLVRIEKVTRRLLALTREAEVERHPTVVGDLLSDVLDLTMVQAKKQSVAVVVEAEFVGEATLNADRVIEGLSSVISNAIGACEAGDTVTVRSALRSAPTRALVIEVEDTGCGISDADLPRVLDPFFTTKPIGEGSGLGLAITRRVMDEHDGEVEIDSHVGQGTLVRLVFPIDSPGGRPSAAGEG